MSVMPARRIKVAYCIDNFFIGGTELNAVRTAEALDPKQFELMIIHLQENGPLRARYEALQVPMVHMPIAKLHSWFTARQGLKLGRLLRNWRADVLHTHDLYTNIFAAPSGRLIGGCKVLASRRWWYDAPRPGLNTLNRWSYRFANLVLANSSGVARILHQQEGLPAAKIVEVPNFLEERAFVTATDERRRQWRAENAIPDGVLVVGVVARLAQVKNHAMLIRALALLDERFVAVLIGDGPLRDMLQRLAESLGVQNCVKFLGMQTPKDNLHANFDVSVLCSLSEGFPNAVIEAMAAAVPVVATSVGGVPDVIDDGRTGLLVPSDSPPALAAALSKLRDDAQLRQSLAQNGQRAVRQRFHQSVVLDKLTQTYMRLAEASASALQRPA